MYEKERGGEFSEPEAKNLAATNGTLCFQSDFIDKNLYKHWSIVYYFS